MRACNFFAVSFIAIACAALATPIMALASMCDTAWDGDQIMKALAGSSPNRTITLRRNQTPVAGVTVQQVQAFYDAKQRISTELGMTPAFIICDSDDVNAFAGNNGGGPVVAVTVGILRMADGNADVAAAVIGHEFAHHMKHHAQVARTREAVVGLISFIAAVALERKVQARAGVAGVGIDIGRLGSTLVVRKFDRDQEREADEVGFQYLVRAGFDPAGAVQLAERMTQRGYAGSGLFDTHPGWDERKAEFERMIAQSSPTPRAVRPITVAAAAARGATDAASVAQSYSATGMESTFVAAVTAYRQGDFATALRHYQSAAKAGYIPAQLTMAQIYLSGQGGVQKNDVEAARLLRNAAEQGDGWGQANLAHMYELGAGGVPKDDREAVRLYRLSVEQGNRAGQAGLAVMYGTGRGGLVRDEVEAVRLSQLAADQGSPIAQANLGMAYETARGGLARDLDKAVYYYRLADQQGNQTARAALRRLGR